MANWKLLDFVQSLPAELLLISMVTGAVTFVLILSTQPALADSFNVFKANSAQWMRKEVADWARSLPDNGQAGFVAWTPPTWGPILQNYEPYPGALPSDAQPLPDPADIGRPVELRAVVNERQYVLIALTSVQETPLELEITTEPVLTGPSGSSERDRVDVRVVGTIRSREYGEVIGPLFSAKDIAGIKSAMSPPEGRQIDWYLVKAPSFIGNWNDISRFPTLSLPPYGTVFLWISLDTTGLLPGDYETSIQVTSLGRTISRNVTIRLRVLPIVLPDRPDLEVIVWDVLPKEPSLRSTYLQDLRTHGVSIFFSGPPLSLQAGERLVVSSGRFWSAVAGRWISPEEAVEWRNRDQKGFEEAVRVGVRTVVREVQESSLVFDQWWLELWDEPSDSTAGIWAEVARVVKAEEPRILLIANPPAHWEQASVTLDGTFRRLAPYVDVWWPFHTHLTAEDGSHLAFMRGTGKPIGYYATPGIFVSKAETAAYGFYRKAAWQAFLHDLQGMGFWAYNSYYGNPWDDMDSGVVDWPDAAVVYPGLWGPIPSRNWEAFRDGLDDYRLLRFLSLEAARAQEASDPYSRERGVELSQALRVLAADMDKAQTVSEVEAVRDRLYDLAADWISRV